MKLIDKDKVREWLEAKKKCEGWCAVGADDADVYYARGVRFTCDTCKDFLDTLEVKEVVDYEEPDLNPIFEEMGVEPNSKIAMAFRNAFYKGIDNFCKRKENKL